MIELTISLLAVPVLWAIANWRLGLLLAVVIGILQDPLRKITPDQPVFFVVLVGIVFAGACLGAWIRGVSLMPSRIFKAYSPIALPARLLLLLIILQAFNSFFRFGNPMIPLIGLLIYLLPLPAVVFANELARRGGEACIYQFMRGYVLCTMLALATVYLEYAGFDWPVLGQVGGTLVIYDVGTVIVPHAGIFRAVEIAAWHSMTCVCFVLLLTTLRKINFQALLTAALVVTFSIGIAILTGRRKSIMEIAIFVSTYFALWLIFEKRLAKLGVVLVIAIVVGFGWLVGQLGPDLPNYVDEGTSDYYFYVERSKTVFQDAPQRFVELGVGPIMWAWDSFGPFGAGVGVGTQGTQHFAGEGAVAGAAEGGLGKIMVELGIPGLFLVGWLATLLLKRLWRIMQAASGSSPRIARLSYGLFSFLVANMAAFSVATQAFGDLFILLILSWTLGFLLAVPELLQREAQARRPAFFEEPAPVFRPVTV